MAAKQNFDPKSAGWIYSVSVFVLTILALLGVGFSDSIPNISQQVQTSISGGSYIALLSVVGVSVLFPVWNLIQKKQKISLKNMFSSTANVVALANAALGIVALTGFVLPAGTVDQLVAAVTVKDWASLIGILFSTVIPTLVRFLKDKKASTET